MECRGKIHTDVAGANVDVNTNTECFVVNVPTIGVSLNLQSGICGLEPIVNRQSPNHQFKNVHAFIAASRTDVAIPDMPFALLVLPFAPIVMRFALIVVLFAKWGAGLSVDELRANDDGAKTWYSRQCVAIIYAGAWVKRQQMTAIRNTAGTKATI